MILKISPFIDDGFPVLIRVCAWCSPGVKGPNLTHVICKHHSDQVRERRKLTPRPANLLCGGTK